ncbi:hypothetical protein B0H11DRAFT_1963891 [Mycena galericulata]|nr:hypothetical protein B0H11DRAFT_1963891 [Mycena galericulata]
MTARYGAHLRALAPHEALNTWLTANITPDLPEWQPLRPHQARFTISMHIAKAEDDGSIFQGPDTYSILLDIELQGQPRSPLMYIGRFVGSSEDGATPMWTRFLKPRHMYSFVDPRSFAALLVCGMTDIHVESVSTVRTDSTLSVACSACWA